MSYQRIHHRILRGVTAVAAFLLGFVVLLLCVTRWYLVPALNAAAGADPTQKRTLAAHALLVMSVVLVVLLVGLLLSFRVGRSLNHGMSLPPKPTAYSDAWAEAARRMETPPAEKDDGEHFGLHGG